MSPYVSESPKFASEHMAPGVSEYKIKCQGMIFRAKSFVPINTARCDSTPKFGKVAALNGEYLMELLEKCAEFTFISSDTTIKLPGMPFTN